MKITLKYRNFRGVLTRHQIGVGVFEYIFFAEDYSKIRALTNENKFKYFSKTNHKIVKRITKYYAI
jgi:hypothetical protein